MQRRTKLQWAAGVVVAVAVAGATMTLVRAFNPQPDPPGRYFGLVGLVEGQSIRLNVTNFSAMPPPGELPPGPCRVSLNFFDAAGNVVATRNVNIRAGMSDSLSLNFTRGESGGGGGAGTVEATGGAGSGRGYLRGAMLFRKAGRDASVSCLASVEVIGADGATNLFLNPGAIVGFNPQPDPPGDVLR